MAIMLLRLRRPSSTDCPTLMDSNTLVVPFAHCTFNFVTNRCARARQAPCGLQIRLMLAMRLRYIGKFLNVASTKSVGPRQKIARRSFCSLAASMTSFITPSKISVRSTLMPLMHQPTITPSQ